MSFAQFRKNNYNHKIVVKSCAVGDDDRECSSSIRVAAVRNLKSRNTGNYRNKKNKTSKKEPSKRQHHNELERRRRDAIKHCFAELSEVIPTVKGTKASRAQILQKSALFFADTEKELNAMKLQQREAAEEERLLDERIRLLNQEEEIKCETNSSDSNGSSGVCVGFDDFNITSPVTPPLNSVKNEPEPSLDDDSLLYSLNFENCEDNFDIFNFDNTVFDDIIRSEVKNELLPLSDELLHGAFSFDAMNPFSDLDMEGSWGKSLLSSST